MEPIEGVVQHYAWGDRQVIPSLLGRAPDGRPWAELWLGTHPGGPATLVGDGPLADVTGPLPYLLKVLTAAEPLSLQAHPDAAQARAGFAAGRYGDPYPKPELLVALGEFHAFCGVRPIVASLELLADVGAPELAEVLDRDGPAAAMADLYHGALEVDPVVTACGRSDRPEARWVTALAARYPSDPSVVATLLLNLVALRPGEAMMLGPGNLHAYLGGAGIEMMGASDNVVRGGLTTKPVDVDDLLEVFDPTPLADPVVPISPAYEVPGTPLRLLRLVGPATHTATRHEVVVTTAGATGYLPPGDELGVAEGVIAFVATG